MPQPPEPSRRRYTGRDEPPVQPRRGFDLLADVLLSETPAPPESPADRAGAGASPPLRQPPETATQPPLEADPAAPLESAPAPEPVPPRPRVVAIVDTSGLEPTLRLSAAVDVGERLVGDEPAAVVLLAGEEAEVYAAGPRPEGDVPVGPAALAAFAGDNRPLVVALADPAPRRRSRAAALSGHVVLVGEADPESTVETYRAAKGWADLEVELSLARAGREPPPAAFDRLQQAARRFLGREVAIEDLPVAAGPPSPQLVAEGLAAADALALLSGDRNARTPATETGPPPCPPPADAEAGPLDTGGAGDYPLAVMTRPSWDTYFMAIAREVATRSTCLRRHVGAVLVVERRILATGYNGAPSGVEHCETVGCLRDQMQVPSGQRHELCRGLHAEQNAIVQAAKHGVAINGATLYTTHHPCSMCAKVAINAGVERIVCQDDYPDDLGKELLASAGVTIELVARENA